jgi:hypothetical protein
MNAIVKITEELLCEALADLSRPHPFAGERVGFLRARAGQLNDGIILLPFAYITVPDDGYARDHRAAAVINETTIRNALQTAYSERVAMVHIHLHNHPGTPRFSGIDISETDMFMPPFTAVRPELPHAAVVRSRDSFAGRCWINSSVIPITRFTVIGNRVWSTS